MRSLPNILKYFMKPQAKSYELPDTEHMADTLEEMVRMKENVPYEGKDQWKRQDDMPPERPPMREPASPMEQQRYEAEQAIRSVSFARAEADAIVRDARLEAEEIIAHAKKTAEREVARIHEEAAEEGYNEGYAKGEAKGREAAGESVKAAAERSIQEVKDFLQHAADLRDSSIDHLRSELPGVAVAVAEKVIHVSLKSSEEIIKRMIITATDKLKRREWVQIYVADCDMKGVTQADPALASALSGLSNHIKIVPMHDAESGTCIVEMPDEIIDASASTQLDNIRSIVRDQS